MLVHQFMYIFSNNPQPERTGEPSSVHERESESNSRGHLDQLLLLDTEQCLSSAPGEGQMCAALCPRLEVICTRRRIRWGRGLPGEEIHGDGMGGENDPAPPRAAPLAPWREGGLLRAEHLNLFPLLWPDTCPLVKDATPEAEPGSIQANVQPRISPPAAKT